jgi:ATP-binding protein involved in chromosome partitioning
MVMKAVQQLLLEVDWRSKTDQADLDCLIIDLPPGTGDVHLSLGQTVFLEGGPQATRSRPTLTSSSLGAVVVSTPQEVALVDFRKSISTFTKLGIPVRSFSRSLEPRPEN